LNKLQPISAAAVADLVEKKRPADLLREAADNPDLTKAEKIRKLWQVAEGFEEMFLNMMFGAMRKTTMESGLMDNSHASKVYRSMHDESLAKQMSQGHEFGMSQMVFDWLTSNRPEFNDLVSTRAHAAEAYQQIDVAGAVQKPEEFADY
jgi:Rod binding domain-containing protein